MELSFDAYWPHWPEGVNGTTVVDVYLQTDLPKLINTLWAPDSPFVAEANRERNFTDFYSTDWKSSEAELPDMPGGFDWTCERSNKTTTIGSIIGKLRKIKFENKTGLGRLSQSVKTEEVQRCVCFVENKKCVVDAGVSLSAPFCEHIRVLCKYNCQVQNTGKTRLTISYYLVYLQSVNFMTKPMLEKGIKSGLISNFQKYCKVLADHIPFVSEESEGTVDVDAQVTTHNNDENESNSLRYEALINWSALPLIALLNVVWSSKDSKKSILIFLWRLCAIILHLLFISFLFGVAATTFEKFLSFGKRSCIPLEFTFSDSLIASFVLMITLEVAQLSLHSILWSLLQLKNMLDFLIRWMTMISFKSKGKLQREESIILNYQDAVEDDIAGPSGDLANEPSHYHQDEDVHRPLSLFSIKRSVSSYLFSGTSESMRFVAGKTLKARTKPDGSVIEEVFENERLQPFRGWGHTWPGHFLPTDACSHWTSFDQNGEMLTSDQFELIEPRLPIGWVWVEDEWVVDQMKDEVQSVDANGWYYALDFPWLKYNRENHGGVRKIHDFVRRKRYYRTRKESPFGKEQPRNKNFQEDEDKQFDESLAARRANPPYFSFLHFL